MSLWKSVTNAFGNEDGEWKTVAKVAGAVAGVGLAGYGVYQAYTHFSQTKVNAKNFKPPPQAIDIQTPEGKLQRALQYKEEGNKMFIAARYEEAKQLYTNALAMCPADEKATLAVFYQNRAATSDSLEQWGAVVEDCTEAIARDELYQKAYSRRGKAKLALQQFDGAVLDTASGYYLQSTKKAKQHLQVFMQAVSEAARVASVRELESRTAPLNFGIEVIRSYVANSPSDPVISNLERYAKVEEAERRPFHRACAKMLVPEPSISIASDLEEELADTTSPLYAEALLLRATLYSIGGVPDRAEKDLDKLISMDSLTPRLRSSALLRRGLHHVTTNAALGLRDLEKASEADPTNPDVYHQKAQICMLMQNLTQAQKDFDKAHELHMKAAGEYNVHVKVHKLTCDLHLTQNAELVEEMKKLCTKHADVAEPWLIYGQTLVFFGQLPQADEAYESSLKLCSDNPKIYIQRAALMLAWKKDRVKAIEYLNIAKALDPACDAVYESLGAVLLQDGQVEEALEVFEQQVRTARTLIECQQACCMHVSTKAQIHVSQKFHLKNLANVFLSPMPVPTSF